MYLTLIYYPLILVLLFWGAKLCKKGEWNEEVLSFRQTKAFLGFCSIVVLLHHCAQRTSAGWIKPSVIRPGLNPFLPVGYLCVAMFFFCSGFGMYTSHREKPDFFKHYLKRRILPLVIPAVFMWLVFRAVEIIKNYKIPDPFILNVFHYVWYVPVLLVLYILFYIGFGLIKNEKAGFLIIFIATIIYIATAEYYTPGTWWYNTHHLFLVGMLTARFSEKIMNVLKKGYILWLILSVIVFVVTFISGSYFYVVIEMTKNYKWYSIVETVSLYGQLISAFTIVLLMVLIGMKVKIGNKVLMFFGSFTLELYLVHPLFVQMFGFAFMSDYNKPVYYIENVFLYVLVVLVLSIPIAFLLSKSISGILKNKKRRA